jgi:DNA-binding XRE family transcriptional regulator
MLDSDRLYEKIGKRVQRIRETTKPRMSQADLAEILGLKRTSITNIENGNQRPTLDTLYRLCEHFALEIAEVVPTVAEVTQPSQESVIVGGASQMVGVLTASVVNRLRPSARSRR